MLKFRLRAEMREALAECLARVDRLEAEIRGIGRPLQRGSPVVPFCSGIRVQGLGFRVQGSGLRV